MSRENKEKFRKKQPTPQKKILKLCSLNIKYPNIRCADDHTKNKAKKLQQLKKLMTLHSCY